MVYSVQFFQVCLSGCLIYKAAISSLDLINERYNFNNASLLPPQLVCTIVLSNCMVLLHFVLKYLICGMKESLQSKMIPRYL